MTEMVKKEKTSDKSTWYKSTKMKYYSTGIEEIGGEIDCMSSVFINNFIGYDIVNYHQKRRSGELLPHTPFRKYTSTSVGRLLWNWDWTQYLSNKRDTLRQYYVPERSVGSNPFPNEEYLATYLADAKKFTSEAAAAIQSSGFDALTFLAEITEVHRMFRDIVKKFLTLDLPSNWRALTCDWLSYRYGWRTFVSDLISLNDMISDHNESRSRYSERRGTKYSTTDHDIDSENVYAYFTLFTSKYRDITVSLTGSVTADIEVPQLQFNPLATAWEVVPLSFVVDWFVSIGVTISTWSFLVNQTAYTASYGCKVTCNFNMTRRHEATSPYFVTGDFTVRANGVSSLEQRVPCSVPLNPHFMLRLNTFKVMDLIALLTQRLRR